MKKNYFKKSLSLIMTVLMIMSCWVFVAPTQAEAALAYGMRAVDGTSKQNATYTTRRTDANNDYVKINYPSVIYMDYTENLADTGYSVNISTTFGSGSNYKLVVLPALWGGQEFNEGGNGTAGTADLQGQTALVDNFTDFGLVNGNLPGYYDNWGIDGGNISLTCQNPANEIGTGGINATFSGKPTKTGTFTYDMSKANGTASHKGTPMTAVYIKTGSGSYTKYSYANDPHGIGSPTCYTIYVYDKAPLNNAINNAQNNYLGKINEYTAASLADLQTAVNSAKTILTTREVSFKQIEDATTAVNNAITSLEKREHELLYENLFSITDWYYSNSSRRHDTNINIDIANGAVTIYNPTTDASTEYTTHSNLGDHTADCYKIDVIGGKTYKFSWNVSVGATSTEVFFMWKNSSGAHIQGPNSSGSYIDYPSVTFTGDGKKTAEFVAPSNATMVELRFDNNTDGTRVTFSNIAVYDKELSAELITATYAPASTVYNYGAGIGTKLPVPTRVGYTFGGWYLDKNNNNIYDSGDTLYTDKDGNVESGLKSSTVTQNYTLKSIWTLNVYTVTYTFLDGNTQIDTYTHGDTLGNPPAHLTKASDAENHYTVIWDKELAGTVTENLSYTETYITTKHNFGDWETVTSVTCTANGEQKQICSDCTYTAYRTVVSQGHQYVSHAAKAATCAEDGNEAYYTCSVCDLYFLAKDGKAVDYNNDIKIAATNKHDFSIYVENSSTGDKNTDRHTVKCAICGIAEERSHLFKGNGIETATCTTPGKTHVKCDCGQTRTDEGQLDPNNHTALQDDVNKKDASCTVPGYTGDTYCNACNTTVEKGEEIPVLDHTFTTYVYQKDATCFKDGTEKSTCDFCNATDTRTAENTQLTHKYTEYTYNNDAKCGVDGTETAACDHGCGTEDTQTAKGTARTHSFAGTVKNNEDGTHSFECTYADCDVYGGTVACSSWKENATEGKCECTVCGYTKNHAWGAWHQASGNTGAAAGSMYQVCSDCGATETKGCVYVQTDYKKETCTSKEFTTYKCNDCGHGYTVIGKDATGHNFNGGAVESHNNGYHSYLCVNDCGAYGIDKTQNAVSACTYEYTNTATGTHKATCTVCGYSKNEACSGGTATCTAEAICDYCKKAYGEKADHSYTGSEKYLFKATEATCIANETYYYYCIGCEQTADGVGTYEKLGTMTEHDYTCKDEYLYIATQAKCGVNETYYAYCSNADCKKSSEDANNTFAKDGTALTHVWDNPINNNDGTHTLYCTNTNSDGWACEETNTLNCVDSAITFGYEASTCTEEGYTTYQCTVCTYTWNGAYVAALGHDYTEQIKDDKHLKDAANCERGDVYWYDCSRCDKNAKDETDTDKYTVLTYTLNNVREHSWTNKVDANYLAEAATCTSAPKYYKSCVYEDCGVKDETQTFYSGDSLGHDWVQPEADKLTGFLATPSDCVTDATYYYVCSRENCGISSKGVTNSTWTKEDSKSGHTLTHTEAKAADCYNAGNYEYWYCSTCKKYFKDVNATEAFAGENETVIAKRSHDIVKVAFKAATCEIDGNPAYEYCKHDGCDYEHYAGNPEDEGYKAKGHNFTGAYTYDAVTGYHSRYCVNANCDQVNVLDENGVVIGTVNTNGLVVDGVNVKYTATYEGLDWIVDGGEKCTFTKYVASTVEGIHSHALECVCGNKSSRAYSDEETFVETVEPTCTTGGYDSYECPECDATWIKNEVAANDHEWAEKATSNGNGTHSVKCTVENCGAIKETANCIGGTATCSAKAKCEVCGGEYGSTGDHVLAEDGWTSNNDAVCGVDGTEWQICSACNEKQTRTDKDSALEHDMSDFGYEVPEGWDAPDFDETTLEEPTCKDYGLSISYCKREGCYHYETSLVEKDESGHEWGDEYPVGDCGTGITYIKECSKCGEKESRLSETDAHTWEEVLRVSGTCTQYGSVKCKCSVCGFEAYIDHVSYDFSKDEVVIGNLTVNVTDLRVKGHVWGDEIVDKPATCGMTGRSHKICSVCQSVENIITEATGAHKLTNNSGVPATCDRNGSEAYKSCTGCSYSETAKVIPAKGHGDNNGDGKCDGCKDSMEEINLRKDGCICHKSNGFMKFIYKILNFFWKLFKINKTCACGTAHY